MHICTYTTTFVRTLIDMHYPTPNPNFFSKFYLKYILKHNTEIVRTVSSPFQLILNLLKKCEFCSILCSMYTHTDTHTRIHKHTHRHTHARTHAHTPTPPIPSMPHQTGARSNHCANNSCSSSFSEIVPSESLNVSLRLFAVCFTVVWISQEAQADILTVYLAKNFRLFSPFHTWKPANGPTESC